MPQGRPVTRPREKMSPFGELLAKRKISPRVLGEALAIAEHRKVRVPTELVNRWVWDQGQPARDRRRILAEMLKAPEDTLFPPPERKPRRPRRPPPTSAVEQQLLETAAQLEVHDTAGAARHLIRAVAQEEIPTTPTSGASTGDLPCIIERKTARRARRPRADHDLDQQAA